MGFAAAEPPQVSRQPLGPPFHHLVVVPAKQRPCHRRQQVHPLFRRSHPPFIAYNGRAVFPAEPPDPRANHITAGSAFQQPAMLYGRGTNLEGQPIGEHPFPGVAPLVADPVVGALFQLDDALHAAPPFRPGLGMINGVPNLRERGFETPCGNECIVCHCRLLELQRAVTSANG